MAPCILLVDDEPLQVAKIIWETESLVVLTSNGSEALSVLDARVVDALLTDLRMPAMSGQELLKQVMAGAKAQSKWPRPMTQGTRDDRFSLSGSGMNTHELAFQRLLGDLKAEVVTIFPPSSSPAYEGR
jgi:CheY-like chemotaxis protein